MADRCVYPELAKVPLLRTYLNIHQENQNRLEHGRRYTSDQKDLITYEYLASGRSFHEFKQSNMVTASRSTVMRRMACSNKTLEEGKYFFQ